MKQFFKFFFASLLGSVAALIMFFFLSFIVVVGIVAIIESDEVVTISPNTILKLEFNRSIPERSQFEEINFSSITSGKIGKRLGLNDIVANIKKAKDDNNIAAIYLKLDNFKAGGYATIDPIRTALLDFKKSDKPIIAHGNYISQPAYYLASVADTIYLTPTGGIDFKGLNAELVFFKKTLDKLEIEAQIIKVGKFKSAVEPFIVEEMSNENREQVSSFVNSINDHLLKNISATRNLELSEVARISNSMLVQSPEDAIKYKLVDRLNYEVEVIEELKSLTGKRKLKTVSLRKYNNVPGASQPSTPNRIAIIYAVGEITGGKGSTTEIGKDNIVDAIRKARKNDNVKGIVMRVNSPGGSALISDIIWKEVELAKKDKPFVVSYGRYAASGGYYISCGADRIISEPITLTGSIGVFAIIPNMQKFFDNKLGITFDGVKTGKYSDFITGSRSLTPDEKRIIQRQVDTIYKTFVNLVVDGRKMTFAEVDKIGQGRIWSGLQALEIGLVDEIGDLDYAVNVVKELAEIEEYRILEYPEIKEPLEELLKTLMGDVTAQIFSNEIDNIFEHFATAMKMVKSKEVQARLPFEIKIN